ncbi:MAG: hypothetical protein ACREB9_06785 [Thermoplasmata archaeon]
MSVVIVVFRLPPKVPNLVATKFCQRLYGQAVSSWGGKYRYRRTGVLDGIPHRKLLRGVVILRESDLAAVRQVLTEFGASVEVRVIQPTAEDRLALQPAAH